MAQASGRRAVNLIAKRCVASIEGSKCYFDELFLVDTIVSICTKYELLLLLLHKLKTDSK
jgi:hypothetical protein